MGYKHATQCTNHYLRKPKQIIEVSQTTKNTIVSSLSLT
jgi:hypothetical protein